MKVTVAIPARLESKRLRRKLLAEVDGKTVLRHAWEGASASDLVSGVFIVTDSPEICAEASSWGASVIETGSDFRNGTERIASVSDRFDSDLIINVQGDQIGLKRDIFARLIETWGRNRENVVTPVFNLSEPAQLQNTGIVKVEKNQSGRAIHFSRSGVPHRLLGDSREKDRIETHFGHVGIYGFAPKLLNTYASLPASENELAERLEQLRFLDNGIEIQTFLTTRPPLSINSPADLAAVREILGAT